MTGRSHEPRASAFARLFEAVHEGVFIGSLAGDGDGATLAANPHLKVMFGYPPATPDAAVAPFAPARFVDPAAREPFMRRLLADGAVTDYLLRLRRIDGQSMWVEVTARAGRDDGGDVHVEALGLPVETRQLPRLIGELACALQIAAS